MPTPIDRDTNALTKGLTYRLLRTLVPSSECPEKIPRNGGINEAKQPPQRGINRKTAEISYMGNNYARTKNVSKKRYYAKDERYTIRCVPMDALQQSPMVGLPVGVPVKRMACYTERVLAWTITYCGS